ncbi:hypothetical protein Vretifemale_6047, partial [Volvox reticuliferus]
SHQSASIILPAFTAPYQKQQLDDGGTWRVAVYSLHSLGSVRDHLGMKGSPCGVSVGVWGRDRRGAGCVGKGFMRWLAESRSNFHLPRVHTVAVLWMAVGTSELLAMLLSVKAALELDTEECLL